MSTKMESFGETGSAKTSMSFLFGRTLKSLPVDLKEFVRLSKTNPDILFTEQTLDRLVQVVLVEQDTRISNKVVNVARDCCNFRNSLLLFLVLSVIQTASHRNPSEHSWHGPRAPVRPTCGPAKLQDMVRR